MIAEKSDESVEILRKEFLELKLSQARLETLFQGFISSQKQTEAITPRSTSFEEAAEHVRRDYSHLLHRLSQ
jgi:hypothetical protein